MKLVVVIPALNEAERIGETIRSTQRASACEVEIIVVDGGSQDETAQRAAGAGARVVSSGPGRARQLAAGARAAGGDVLLFLHADTRLPEGFDRAALCALGDPGVVGGAFRLRFDTRSLGLRIIEWGTRLRVALFRLPYGDQALFVRRATLEEMGGVPQAPIMEDLDLVDAMKRRGRLALLPLPAVTSARRYTAHGTLRTALRHWAAMFA
ncbi:MAG: TIGR04283 family arsenosugar biosynthesis glycosyltransferase, partial [Myxococcota bacterium]